MQTCTLLYQDKDDNVFSRDFNVYGGNVSNVRFVRKTHSPLLNGGNRVSPIGYFYEISIDFMPIPSKQDVYWMQGFAFGHNRQLQLNGGTIFSVTLSDDTLLYDFIDQTYFANAFTLNFKERNLRTVTDDGSTRIIRPSYSRADLNGSISSGVFQKYMNLVDDCSINIFKNNQEFIDGQVDDVAFGFVHNFKIDFGVISDSSQRDWLVEFCLWENKRIDTTGIDTDNGRLYDVVFLGDRLEWSFDSGLHTALATSLEFVGKDLMTSPEQFLTAVDVFILDESELDSGKVAG